MDLSVTRRILSVIIAVFTALAVCVLAVSMLFSPTLGSQDFLEKRFVTEELEAECNAQLDVKFAVLAAESGVPLRVFQAAETNYSTKTALTSAFRNLFGDEAPELYNQSMIDYFNKLIAEYLDAANTPYQSENVYCVAEQAAKIFSETVGLHHTGAAKIRFDAMRSLARRATVVSAILLVICLALLLLLYRNSLKALTYLFAGMAAGGFGTLLGTLLCLITRVHTRVAISPLIYRDIFAGMLRVYFVYLALLSAVITVVFYILMYIAYSRSHQKSQRQLIF